jgi:hypothetical protein
MSCHFMLSLSDKLVEKSDVCFDLMKTKDCGVLLWTKKIV